MLAYCTALGLRDGHLVYAKGNEAQISHRLRNVDVTIHAHTLDLLLSPSQLIEQVATLACVIAEVGLDTVNPFFFAPRSRALLAGEAG